MRVIGKGKTNRSQTPGREVNPRSTVLIHGQQVSAPALCVRGYIWHSFNWMVPRSSSKEILLPRIGCDDLQRAFGEVQQWSWCVKWDQEPLSLSSLCTVSKMHSSSQQGPRLISLKDKSHDGHQDGSGWTALCGARSQKHNAALIAVAEKNNIFPSRFRIIFTSVSVTLFA